MYSDILYIYGVLEVSMAVRDNQKMIVLTEKKLIDALTQEEASRKNINRSNVIEEILLSAMMTRNENVKSWLKNLYTEHISLKHFIEEMWQVLAEECEQNVKVKDIVVSHSHILYHK